MRNKALRKGVNICSNLFLLACPTRNNPKEMGFYVLRLLDNQINIEGRATK
jgi:hypothetical protein